MRPGGRGNSPLRSGSPLRPCKPSHLIPPDGPDPAHDPALFYPAKYSTNADYRDGGEDDPAKDQLIGGRKVSNTTLREQYYRQINLCKKTGLNYYEASVLVGQLLDLIYLSRKLEVAKVKLITSSEDFNMMDAYSYLESKISSTSYLNQIEFREALLQCGLKADRVSMDRIYLFFKRFNLGGNDRLSFGDFVSAIVPVNPRMAHLLKQRPARLRLQAMDEAFGHHILTAFAAVLDLAIDTEVAMEVIRQKLASREQFDIGKAFLTMLAAQRDGSDRDSELAGAYHPGGLPKFITIRDLEVLMKKHNHFDSLEQDDLPLLISRFDRDVDGRISLNEFFEQMEPHSHRQYYKPEEKKGK